MERCHGIDNYFKFGHFLGLRVRKSYATFKMSRTFMPSINTRQVFSRGYSRLFSTSRPAKRLSTSCEIVHRRASAAAAVGASFHTPSISRRPPSRCYIRQSVASFSSSSVRAATQVLQNPRTGDDGATLMINISPRAAERLREITDPTSSPSAIQEENPYNHLRITVTSGGCHGFQYMMSLESASKIDAEEDTIFQGEAETATSEGGEAKVVMDEPSLELLSGSTVDYTTELIGSQFKIVDNPRATSNCGCGTSFDVMD
ncbi:hypothetical protein N7495_000209 [Penicillium taxi]|uniref:uncharacterized protein n=1 Tax=Penicillium taxi TaxID=168475 RepID=UPI002545B1F3|nr:uncharacterized protein N7495_000209 [Penicillium taxi]KAJ5907527.1 hypothetical protein N7495_000209 [Penicillium taxi]